MLVISLLFIFILVYTWGIYPVILLFIERTGNSKMIEQKNKTEFPVAVVLSAYNEEKCLASRLKNLLELDYPSELLDIYVGLDGCSDKSMDVVKEIASKNDNIHIFDFSVRRGKVAVLKDLVRNAVDDKGKDILLLFTDANTMFLPDILRKMLPYFNDEEIGGICGRLIFVKSVSEYYEKETKWDAPELSYWGLETRFKIAESHIDSCLGANGAIYIMRAPLFSTDIPDNTLIDDFVLGMKIREYGYRMIYEPEAIAIEVLPDQSAEWTRRVRIGAGGYQAIKLCGKCLLPHYGKFAWMFWSHKILRWFTPHIILALIISSTILISDYTGEYKNILYIIVGVLLVIIFFTIILVRFFSIKQTGKILRIFRLMWHFLVMQVALFVGFIHFCRGGLHGYWTRTPR